MVGLNNKAPIIYQTKWTLIGCNICSLMRFCLRFQGRPPWEWKSRSRLCLPEMFGAILGDPWVAGLRWCVVSAGPDRWLFWCGQTWWVWLDMGQFLLGCQTRRRDISSQQRALVMNIHWPSSMLYIYSWIAKRKAESPFHYWFIFNGRRKGRESRFHVNMYS